VTGGRSPRVAFVLPTLNGGGAERAALNLASATPRSECLVIAEAPVGDLTADPLASRVVIASEAQRPTNRVERIRRLTKVLWRVRPDLVVSTLSPLVSTAAALLAGVPVMHWLQAPWMRTTAAGGRGLVPASHRLALRTLARQARLVAATTPGLLDECLALGFAKRKLALLPNGLVLPPVSTREPKGDRSLIVMVGRLEPPKRPDLLLEAVALLSSERDIGLVLVGSGTQRPELEQRAEALGIAGRVTFTGFVPDPSPHIRSADAFVLATDYEGFGNVIVEALACGVPAVVSDVPYGPRFILSSTRLGRLVAPGSAEALADGLRVVLERPPTEEERVEGRRRAEDFSIDRVAAQFEELIDRVLVL
jgi:glycosyltransferase involved in cell wall biosynthesis